MTDLSIGIFLPNLSGGGAERAMLHLAEGLCQHGFKIDLVLVKAEGDYLDLVPSAVRIVDLRSKFPLVLSKTIALRRYLQHENPAIIFSALDLVGSALWAKWWANSQPHGSTRVSTRVVMCIQTFLSGQFQDDQRYTIAPIRAQMVRWLYPKANGLIAASHGTAEDLAHLIAVPVEQIRVVYNPVITPAVLQKIQEPIEHPWFSPGEPPVILGVGRLVAQKDFFTLVRAFQQVRQQRPARLMILGEGSDRSDLEKLIQNLSLEDDVALPGFVDNPYAYMAKAAVFALSSKYEGFGNVVAEAMAAGTSIVSTDCPSGPAEILENGNYGTLVAIADPEAMASAIIKTLDHPAQAELLKARSLAFSSDRVIKQYVDIIHQILQDT